MTRTPRTWTQTAACECGASRLTVTLGPVEWLTAKHRPNTEVASSMECLICGTVAEVTVGELRRAA